ncbi:G-protein coupled receptor Mth2-like isoform X18 [Onthophagus taurus]|uniref:G-protein coupled receptor Mth2-like isoform X18 n=1 Tax=Onthophagus taurus TaxID=166361 RepID=UPI0039BECB25
MHVGLVFVLIFFVLASLCHSADSRKCHPTIDISDGLQEEDHIIKDNIKYAPDNYYIENGIIYGCICDVKLCVRKCCPLTETLQHKACTTNLNHNFMKDVEAKLINSSTPFDSFHIINGMLDCGEKSRFKLNYDDNFNVLPNGNLYWFEEYNHRDYCLDYFGSPPTKLSAVICSEEDHSVPLFHYSIGMIISMPFLIATFLVYALLPDKNLPAKSLMCYVLSLLFAYIMLVTIQLNSNLEHGACVTIAYLCYFFFMVSFFWMNSSCIDIWLTFSGIKGITGQRTQERKRFIYYCLYSWGLPLIMTSIVVVMTMEHLKDSIFFTAIGDGQCWFKNGLSTGIYFYFPIAILLITNIVLFAITALKIRNVQRDTKVLNAKDSSKHEKDKQRFNLYIKLLFAMGVNWSMEVISWLVQWQSNNVPTYIWYITDFCNAMYGVLIFFIFVFKKNIWIMLKKRYLQIMGRSTRAHSMGTSTHRTTLFTAISLQSIPGAGLLTKMHSTPNDNRNELRPPKIH